MSFPAAKTFTLVFVSLAAFAGLIFVAVQVNKPNIEPKRELAVVKVVKAVRADVQGIKATVRSVKKAADKVAVVAQNADSVIVTGKSTTQKIAKPFKAAGRGVKKVGKFFGKIGKKIGHKAECGLDNWACE